MNARQDYDGRLHDLEEIARIRQQLEAFVDAVYGRRKPPAVRKRKPPKPAKPGQKGRRR